MDIQPKVNKQISPYFVFFLISGMQIGVGMLGFQRIIAKVSGNDAWISVLISGVSINLLLWMCYKLLSRNEQTIDIVGIHRDLFGKWVGGLLSSIFVIYFMGTAIVVLRTYLEVIQVWMFPELNIPILLVVMLLLVYSYIIGGLRTVTGFMLIGKLFILLLLPLLSFPMKHAHLSNLAPVWDHSFMEILEGSKAMTLNYLGFELILMYYPFIKQPIRSKKWAHLGALFTTFIYVITMLATLIYYHQEQLKDVIWATLTFWKVITLPLVERFEYIGISIWLFVILPNVCLGFWAASRGMKRVFNMKQKKAVVVFMVISYIICILLDTRQDIDQLNTFVSQVGFYIVYAYIPFLFILQMIVYKVRERKK
jgi:spore germination protein (amino acid permease)